MNHAFPCGTLPLDFAGTLRARRNPTPLEKLAAPGDLGEWFVESGMFDAAPEVSSAALAQAVALREAVYSLALARIRGNALPADAVALVNRVAGLGSVRFSLVDGSTARAGTAVDGLGSLAREAITIVGGPDAPLLRECGRPECTQVYLDRSRGHRREWCSMKTCGNRVKASAFRARHRVATEAR